MEYVLAAKLSSLVLRTVLLDLCAIFLRSCQGSGARLRAKLFRMLFTGTVPH